MSVTTTLVDSMKGKKAALCLGMGNFGFVWLLLSMS